MNGCWSASFAEVSVICENGIAAKTDRKMDILSDRAVFHTKAKVNVEPSGKDGFAVFKKQSNSLIQMEIQRGC